MMRKRGKKSIKGGQIELSFGTIFSIILIIVFLAFAFYAIKTFLSFQDNAKAGKLFSDFQSDVNTAWRSAVTSQGYYYAVPSGVDMICLVDFNSGARGSNSALYTGLKKAYTGKENLIFYPVKFTGFESIGIDHLNLTSIVLQENPYCINATDGKISVVLSKDFGEALVSVSRQ